MKKNLTSDALASIVVFLVALPLCMGIAIASGVPPALGLATGIIGGLVVGALAGSPLQVSGPAAGLAVIVYEIIQDHGITMLGPILLVAGAIQLFAGLAKLGRWFRAISPSVVYGMLAGIGVLILAAQFHVMVDDKPRSSGIQNLLSIPESVMKGIFPVDGSSHHIAAAIGLLTIAIILLWNKFKPASLKLLPGALIAVVVSTGLAVALQLPIQRVNIPENLFSSFSFPTMATLANMMNPSILLTAVALAVVASAETLLSAAAVDRMHSGPRTNYDKELASQGVGNILCGAIGALPMTGVIVRSSTNVQAGATSRLSTIMHGGWLLAFVMLMPFVLRAVPTAALAAILVYTGWKLVDVTNIRRLAEYGRVPVLIYAATVIGIVVTDLLTGVLIGLGMSIIKVIYRTTHLRMDVKYDAPQRRADIWFDGAMTFMRLPQIASLLEDIPRGTVVHVHLDQVYYVDHTCLDLLKSWSQQQAESGGAVDMCWDSLQERYQLPSGKPGPGEAARASANAGAGALVS